MLDIKPIVKRYVPKDYCYPYAIDKFVTYFRNRRADNIKEAINLFEDELIKSEMISLQEDILFENQKQSFYSLITALYTMY